MKKREKIFPQQKEKKGENDKKKNILKEMPNRVTRNRRLKELEMSHDMCALWVPGYFYNCTRWNFGFSPTC